MQPEKKKKVLIVDDQKSLLWGLEKFLSGKGFEVETSADGAEGREKLLSGDYDVAVLDLRLPGKSGMEILEECAGLTSARFILVSAYATADDVEKALTLGAKDYLAKPFEPEALFESISHILYGGEIGRAKESIKWMTIPAFPDARIDAFYAEKNDFWVEAFDNGRKERVVIITKDLTPYESGYLSAVLDSWEDFSKSDSLIESLQKRVPSGRISAVINLNSGEALCLHREAKLLRGKKYAEAGAKRTSLKKGDRLFLIAEDGQGAPGSADLPDLCAIDEESRYQGPFFSMASIKTLKDRMLIKPVTSVIVVTYGDAGGLSSIEEDVPPELITREGIFRHAMSLPPSQFLSEAQRNKIHLLLCEAASSIRERGCRMNLRIELKGHLMKSLSVSAEGIGLMRDEKKGRPAAEDAAGLSALTREQVRYCLLESTFSAGELEVPAKKDKMILHF
jgi:CheY-like chemotaxis protein